MSFDLVGTALLDFDADTLLFVLLSNCSIFLTLFLIQLGLFSWILMLMPVSLPRAPTCLMSPYQVSRLCISRVAEYCYTVHGVYNVQCTFVSDVYFILFDLGIQQSLTIESFFYQFLLEINNVFVFFSLRQIYINWHKFVFENLLKQFNLNFQ